MGLKGLLSKVINLARGVGDEEPPGQEPGSLPRDGAEEPIRTKTMAELLVQQGHLERAAAIYAELEGEEERLSEIQGLLFRRALEHRAATFEGDGLGIARDDGHTALAWRIGEPGLRRAQGLLGEGGRLALRTVLVGREGAHVRREEADQDLAAAEGALTLEVAPEVRVIVSVGLLHDARFVSIAHASG